MALVPAFEIGLYNGWIFMSVFLIQMLAIMLINKRARERSHIPREARRNKFERNVGFTGNFIWLLALCYSVFLPLQSGTTWLYIGNAVFLIGLTLMAIATYNFIVTPPNQLITKGAYKFSRHPMYLATFLICMGAGIAALSWLFIFLSLIMAFCFYHEALIEERYCLSKYGKAYQDYINRTPILFGVIRKSDIWKTDILRH